MSKQKALALMILMSVALLAGCSGILPGEESPAPTQTPGETPESTPSITPGMTPTVTPEPTPPATPVPPSENHQLFARQVGAELEKSRPNDQWVQKTEGHTNNTISVYVENPPEWTVKRTEMEAVREAVRGTVIGTTPDVSEATETDKFVRPGKIYIHVQTPDRRPLTTIAVDTKSAADYADTELSIAKFAESLSDTREVHSNSLDLSGNSTLNYLKYAEWRPLVQEQLRIINNSKVAGSNETVTVDRRNIRVIDDEIYYEYSPPSAGDSHVREGTFMRTYWEAVRNVSRDRLIHRYPERMRVYANVPGDADMESSIRTEYAFDFLEITGGDISDENILTSGAWDAYYNKINRTYHEDS